MRVLLGDQAQGLVRRGVPLQPAFAGAGLRGQAGSGGGFRAPAAQCRLERQQTKAGRLGLLDGRRGRLIPTTLASPLSDIEKEFAGRLEVELPPWARSKIARQRRVITFDWEI
jgi:hypothetical protein